MTAERVVISPKTYRVFKHPFTTSDLTVVVSVIKALLPQITCCSVIVMAKTLILRL